MSDRAELGHKVGHKIEPRALASAGETAERLEGSLTEAAAPTTSIRADMGRALADSLARALAAGDTRAARIALTALGGLMDDAPDAGPGGPVIDLATGHERRGR